MEEDRPIAVVAHPSDRGLDPLRMIGDVIAIKRPEVLFMREQIHDLGSVLSP